MIFMCGSLKALTGLSLVLLLAGEPPMQPAAAQTVRAAEESESAGGSERGSDAPRVQTYTRELAPGAIEGRLESLLGRGSRPGTRSRQDHRHPVRSTAWCGRSGQFGGFGIGTRRIAVDWSMLKFDAGAKQPSLVLDMTRDQLRSAPEYKPGEPVVVFVGRAD
jgi:hypothetical protein